MIVSRESSPYIENSSPLTDKVSPRAFWSSRETLSPSRFDENMPDRSPSPSLVSPKRRSSIERLKQASRVKNSGIFALESKGVYDPTSTPIVERPTMNRPLSHQLMNNSFHRYDSLRKENNPVRSPQRPGHKRSETEISVPILSPSKEAANVPLPASPNKQASPSPTKSSMARTSMFGASPQSTFDPEHGTWSDDERNLTPRARGLHRYHKSVTFHADPPEVNEYEEQTPEPSVSMGSREGSWDSDDFDDQDMSFERGSSVDMPNHDVDDSFDEDLENAEKTPVVLPEDWSRMSPNDARTDLADGEDDVFDASPSSQRITSDSRPLPPLPPFGPIPKRGSISRDDIMNMRRRLSVDDEETRPDSKDSAETIHGVQDELIITNLDTGEKIDLSVPGTEGEMQEDSMVADLAEFANAPPRISRESILRNVRNTKYDYDDEEDETEMSMIQHQLQRPSYEEMARMDPDQPIPSRENSRETSSTYLDHYSAEENIIERQIKEEPNDHDGIDLNSIPSIDVGHLEPPQSSLLMDDYDRQSSVIRHQVHSDSSEVEDYTSRYSSDEPEAESTMLCNREPAENAEKETLRDAMELLTVKEYGQPGQAELNSSDFMGLPAYLGTGDFDFGMDKYIAPSPTASNENTTRLTLGAGPFLKSPRKPATPPERSESSYDGVHRDVSPPETPKSVVNHCESEVSSMHSYEEEQVPIIASPIVPDIPERRSTIKTGGKLKARFSSTPADLGAMAEQRRIVSQEHPVPAIPLAYQGDTRAVLDEQVSDGYSVHSSEGSESVKADSLVDAEKPLKHRETKSMTLDIPLGGGEGDDLSKGLDVEFERVIESQKVGTLHYPLPHYARFNPASQQHKQHFKYANRPYVSAEAAGGVTPYTPHTRGADANVFLCTQKGYLMRHNTKVVVASNRNFSNDSSGTTSSKTSDGVPMSPTMEERPAKVTKSKNADGSPRKGSAEQYLKTEPWNGKMRRKSVRNASVQKATHSREPAPPLPGQESALGVVDEDFAAGTGSLEEEMADGVERGRLFVKVVGVKDLDLPMPKNDRIYFQLTLDNGLHCVTTTSLELGQNAPIGQEFELVVLNDLEFQLTLTTKLPSPPAVRTPAPSSPSKHSKSPSKSGFSRFLSSPKKRAERERQEREAAEAEERRLQEEAMRKRASAPPTAWDLLHELVNASDGSFARAYVNLKSHEKQCFGRQLIVDVPCYNEWALENDTQVVNSVRSKRGTNAGPIRRPPYVVGKLELQLFYVPKPKGATDEEMPKSMGGAIREMAKAADVVEVVHEGHLSQQGGDCTVSRPSHTGFYGPY